MVSANRLEETNEQKTDVLPPHPPRKSARPKAPAQPPVSEPAQAEEKPAAQERPAAQEKSAAPPWLGKRVGHFKLLGLLGQGAMGRVFRVEDTLLRRYVALKVLPKSVKRGEKVIAIERLIHEAQAVATLDHPNVVTVYEVNEASGVYYIAMELAEGGSLRELVKAAGPLEYQRACLLCADAADALAHAHSLGIVHRDVKPANLMLTRSGRCKVTDFGLARGVESSELSKPIPESVGTPQFIAPELLRGEVASPSSDLYSLGATLWYLLTGRAVFEASSTAELLQKHVEAPVPDLTTLRPDVPATLAKALQRAMAKKPEDRFESAAQFSKVLRLHTIPVETSGSFALAGLSGVSGMSEDTAMMSLSSIRSATQVAAGAGHAPPVLSAGRNRKVLVGAACAAAALLLAAMVPAYKLVSGPHEAKGNAAVSQTSAAVAPAQAANPQPAVTLVQTPVPAPAPQPVRFTPPPGWVPIDVGGPRLAGNTTFDGTTWTLTGAGVDIYFDRDQFHFVSRSFAGDGVFIARVDEIHGKDERAKAGLMFRADTTGPSAYVDMLAEAGKLVTFQWRPATGKPTVFATAAGVELPVWLKLVRTDDTFRGYYSKDGETWHQVGGNQLVPMPATLRAGLAITSHDKASLANAKVTHVMLTDSNGVEK